MPTHINIQSRLTKLEEQDSPVFCDGGVVTGLALAKLTLVERRLLHETRQRWRDGDRTDSQRAVYDKWSKVLAETMEETGFPYRLEALDWDFRDDELEEIRRQETLTGERIMEVPSRSDKESPPRAKRRAGRE